MERQRKCPACGAGVSDKIAECPVCGLKGLDLRFLNKAGYENWVKEVLEPHKASLVPRVFAGADFGLILTVGGNLYGIGSNAHRQLSDTAQTHFDQPVLVARDVISAAAAGWNTLYVTRDGKTHWQSEDRDVLPVLAGVQEVYGESGYVRFWLVRSSGEVLCFGNNSDEVLAKRTRVLACEMPEVTCLDHSLGAYTEWSDGGDSAAIWGPEHHFKRKEAYQKLVQRHGPSNVELDVNEIEPNKLKKAMYFALQIWMYAYRPRIYVTNKWIRDPIPFTEKWRAEEPHRRHGTPVLEEEYRRVGWEKMPGVKTVSQGQCFLHILQDGSVIATATNPNKLDWLQHPVREAAISNGVIILACSNKDILWCVGEWPLEEWSWNKLLRGQMNVTRLPENA